jgi:small subunit ribosomal protein S4
MKLFLKGDRCFSEKCSIERRNYPPGQHGQGRPKFSDYGQQLREKQKVRRIYGILEAQFRKTVYEASHLKGVKGENLIALLERRLDNVVFRRRVDIPSYRVRKGDKIELTARGQKAARIEGALGALESRSIPSWLSIDKDQKQGTILGDPVRDEITLPIQEQLIIELYSR